MPDIRLGDYTGFLLQEMLRARELADAYSRSMAQKYAEDPVLRHFSVPRYLVPKLELTVPVLMSEVTFAQAARFVCPVEEFIASMVSRADDVRSTVELLRGRRSGRLPPDRWERGVGSVDRLARRFHDELKSNADPLHPHGIVKAWWLDIFRTCLREADLLEFYEREEPSQDLLQTSTQDVLALVLRRTAVEQTVIEDVRVDPETNVVKNASSGDSLFTIRAELQEEAFFLRWVRNEKTEEVTPIVEYQ